MMFIPNKKHMDGDVSEDPDYVEGWNDCVDEMQRLIKLRPQIISKFGKVVLDGQKGIGIEGFDFIGVTASSMQFIDELSMAFRLLLIVHEQEICDILNEAKSQGAL